MSAPEELIVIVGDAHVGMRAADIPEKFKKMQLPDKMQYLVSTGNLGSSETIDYFRQITPKMIAVRGDMDDYDSFPEETVFQVGEFRLGVIHGHQIIPWGEKEALGLIARRLNVDILITGHTHVSEFVEYDSSTWFINPGSITGAFTPLQSNVNPNFTLSISQNVVKFYQYELNLETGQVDIGRKRFTKSSTLNPFGALPIFEAPPPQPVITKVESTPITTVDSIIMSSPTKIKQVENSESIKKEEENKSSPIKKISPLRPSIPKRPQNNEESLIPTKKPVEDFLPPSETNINELNKFIPKEEVSKGIIEKEMEKEEELLTRLENISIQDENLNIEKIEKKQDNEESMWDEPVMGTDSFLKNETENDDIFEDVE
jgi:vacuolar protein sorting-associated protein 29